MNEGAKQAYLDQSAAQLREWGAKVEVVKAKVAQGTAGLRIDFHNQIERWQEKETTFKQKLEELRSSGVEGFEALKAGVQNVWTEITTLVESFEDKKNEAQK